MKTLNDNWFEDRLQPAGGLSATGNLHLKTARPVETDLAYIGEKYQLLTRVARQPVRASFATPDDGFRERDSTHKTEFKHPRSYGEPKAPQNPTLITTENAPVLPPEKRELEGPRSGHGAAINRHPPNHDQRWFNTSNGDFYGEGGSRLKRGLRSSCSAPDLNRGAGLTSEHTEYRATATGRAVGKLVGEVYRESDNPATDTKTQKQWLYAPCQGVSNVHLGGAKQRAMGPDNHMSLPLGEGNMAKIRETMKARGGVFGRTATHITKSSSQISGIKIFRDAD